MCVCSDSASCKRNTVNGTLWTDTDYISLTAPLSADAAIEA